MIARRTVLAAILALGCVTAAQAADAPPLGGLSLPAACDVGRTCWVVNYPEAAAGKDYRCGARTYAGHDGTDIGPADHAATERGIDVLAVAPGTVAAVRDGLPDGAFATWGAGAVRGRECGNGVVIRHADGWETQYCHLRKDSIAVKAGEAVARGAVLGRIGMSGQAAFPHVHLGVRHGAEKVDPFTGAAVEAGCGRPASGSLWRGGEAPPYLPAVIYAAGLTQRVPTEREIKDDAAIPHAPAARNADLVAWAATFGLDPDQEMRIVLIAPDGSVLARRAARVESSKAWQFAAVGRRVPDGGWPAGTYRVEAEVSSGGAVISRRVESVVFTSASAAP